MESLCFLNFLIRLVSVSYFAQDLNYVSYKVILIKGTACMTPLGIGISVIHTDCHINRSFLLQEGPFWDQKPVI